jgi:hypothetical protein
MGRTAQIPDVTQNLLETNTAPRLHDKEYSEGESTTLNRSPIASTMQSATVMRYPVATPKHLSATDKSIKIVHLGIVR